MLIPLILFCAAALLAGCADLDDLLKDPAEESNAHSCQFYFQPVAHVTNWTGADLSLEMSYGEGLDRKVTQVQVASGQSAHPALPPYTKVENYSWQSCPNYGIQYDNTALKLTPLSYAAAKACVLDGSQDWVILVPKTGTCPPYSKQQGKPL